MRCTVVTRLITSFHCPELRDGLTERYAPTALRIFKFFFKLPDSKGESGASLAAFVMGEKWRKARQSLGSSLLKSIPLCHKHAPHLSI